MSAREWAASSLLAAIFFCLFFSATKTNFYRLQLDSAFMVEMIDTIFEQGIPRTRLTKSVIVAIETLVTKPAQQVCAMPLTPETPEWMNVFDRHAFPVLYLTAPFRLLFGSKPIAFFLHSIGFAGLLYLSYVILRIRGVSIGASMAMVFLVSAHPAWSYSAFGQFGPDKLFLPIGAAYVFLLYERLKESKLRSGAVASVALLAILVTERTSIMIGAATVAGLVLYRRFHWRDDPLLLTIAAVAIAYPLVYGAEFQSNPDYGSFRRSMAQFPEFVLHDPRFAGMLGMFLLINIPLFGALGVFEWKLAVIALGAMAPNILGTVGGAEKTGWSTHYHAIYFPFLVAAALLGFAGLCNRIKNAPGRSVIAAVPVMLGAMLLLIDPYAVIPSVSFSAQNLKNYGVWRMMEGQLSQHTLVAESNYYREIAASVPPGAEVTANEPMMPSLYGNHLIHYYPLGLPVSEYAVIPYYYRPDGGLRFTGAVSYLGPAEKSRLNECLTDRLRLDGYEVSKLHPDRGGVNGYAVLKRRAR